MSSTTYTGLMVILWTVVIVLTTFAAAAILISARKRHAQTSAPPLPTEAASQTDVPPTPAALPQLSKRQRLIVMSTTAVLLSAGVGVIFMMLADAGETATCYAPAPVSTDALTTVQSVVSAQLATWQAAQDRTLRRASPLALGYPPPPVDGVYYGYCGERMSFFVVAVGADDFAWLPNGALHDCELFSDLLLYEQALSDGWYAVDVPDLLVSRLVRQATVDWGETVHQARQDVNGA